MEFENSTLKIKPTPEFLAHLAEHLDSLKAAGIDVEVHLRSTKFKGIEKDESGKDYLRIDPEGQLISAMEKLAPFTVVLYEYTRKGRITKYSNAKLYFNLDYVPVKVRCPFCGFEQSYVLNYLPYSYPPNCKICGAMVRSCVGYEKDVLKDITDMMPTESGAKILKVSKDIVIARDDLGRDVVAVSRNWDEEESMGEWIIFYQTRLVPLSAKDLAKLVLSEEGLTRIGIKLRFIGEEGKDYVIKNPHTAGRGSAAIYVPRDWLNSKVLAIRLKDR